MMCRKVRDNPNRLVAHVSSRVIEGSSGDTVLLVDAAGSVEESVEAESTVPQKHN
jgi:hypothetical protein